jgi:hypothetical protein
MPRDPATSPGELYDGDGDIGLYDDNASAGGRQDAYQQRIQQAAAQYAAAPQVSEYGSNQVSAPEQGGTRDINQYLDRLAEYDRTPVDPAILQETGYQAEELSPADDVDVDALLAAYDDAVAERMDRYDLNPEDGWAPLLEEDAYDEITDDILEDVDEALDDAYGTTVDGQQYVTGGEDELLPEDDLELYGRYLEDDDGEEYLEVAVVEQEMPDGLFGFTRPENETVVFVNKALYEVDKENTKLHEMTHQEHPHWSEFMVRSRRTRGGGDIDPQYTMSFQANNPARIGDGPKYSRQNAYTGA